MFWAGRERWRTSKQIRRRNQHRLIVREPEAPVVVVEEEKPPRETKRQHVASIDIFRGFTVAVISYYYYYKLYKLVIAYGTTSQNSIKSMRYNLLDTYCATSRYNIYFFTKINSFTIIFHFVIKRSPSFFNHNLQEEIDVGARGT